MLQVAFRNLLPCERLVGVAKQALLELRAQAGKGGRVTCCVAISADPAQAQGRHYRVQVELARGTRQACHVVTHGGDAHAALRSGLRAATQQALAAASAPSWPARSDPLACAL